MPSNEQGPIEYNIKKRPIHPRWDTAVVGLILGIIFPLIGILIMYLIQWRDLPLTRYFHMFTNVGFSQDRNAASKVISLAVVFNLIPFYFFKMKNAYEALRGVVIASALFLVLVVLYLFVW